MIVWIDAQISPAVARWLAHRFVVEAYHVNEMGFVESSDAGIFEAARLVDAVVITKDRDFVNLVRRRGTPPRIIWVTCGNTSNREMTEILSVTFENACELIASGEPVVEIKG